MNCIVCGAASWRYLFPARDRMFGMPGVFSQYRCTKCGLVRLEPKPTPRELIKYYPAAKYYSYNEAGKKDFFGRLRSYLISHVYRPTLLSRVIGFFVQVPAMPTTKPGRILDIGCGSGDTLALLKSAGWDVYGLDINAAAVAIARKRGLKNVSPGSYENLKEYKDGYFDAIRLYHVIEHLDDPAMCLRLVRNKLKPGGEIIIGTPNASSVIARIAGRYWYNLDCPRHLYLFTPRTLTRLVSVNGFKDQEVAFCSAGGWVGSIQYMLEEMLHTRIRLINVLAVILFYPLEWTLDRLALGDVFVLRAAK